jgi:Gas vesicle protein G.
MGLLTTLLTLPVSGPVRGAVWTLGKVVDAAEAEFYDPAAIRRELDALEARLEAGEIDEPTFEAAEEALLDRLEDGARRGR